MAKFVPERAMSLFNAFDATFDTAAHGEDVLIEGESLFSEFALTLEGELHKAVHKIFEAEACGFPEVVGERTGDGVDFVDVHLVGVGIDEQVHAAHAVARQHAESFAGEVLDAFGHFVR